MKKLHGIICALACLSLMSFISCVEEEEEEASISFSAESTTVNSGNNITGTLKFENFDKIPSKVDLYIEGESDPVAGDLTVTAGKITVPTAGFPLGTYKAYVKSGDYKSNSISVRIVKAYTCTSYRYVATTDNGTETNEFTNLATSLEVGDGPFGIELDWDYGNEDSYTGIVVCTIEPVIQPNGKLEYEVEIDEDLSTEHGPRDFINSKPDDYYLEGAFEFVKKIIITGDSTLEFVNGSKTYQGTYTNSSVSYTDGSKTVTFETFNNSDTAYRLRQTVTDAAEDTTEYVWTFTLED